MELTNTTLAILTWCAPQTLAGTLSSLRGIRNAFEDALIVCQAGDPAELELAHRFGYRAISTPRNIGIQNGLKLAVQQSRTNQVLVLENDNRLADTDHFELLMHAQELLQSGTVQVVQLADAQHSLDDRAHLYWRGFPPRRTPLGYIRRDQAQAWLVRYCLMHKFPVDKILEDACHLYKNSIMVTDSRYMPWSNRAFYVRRNFFLNQLLPLAESSRSPRLVNGYPELEQAINGSVSFPNRWTPH